MTKGCTCSAPQRAWRSNGVCATCSNAITEGQLQDAIRVALGTMTDVLLYRNNIGHAVMHGGGRVTFGVGGPGGADLIGIFRGRFLAIEVKTPTGRQSKEQRQFQELVTARGGIYLMPRSVAECVDAIAELRTKEVAA